MTHDDSVRFVETEIRTRYKTLNDTQFSDWVAAVQYHTVSSATQIIRDLVQHPDLTITLKAFKKLAWERREKKHHVEATDKTGYDPWVRCISAPPEHPTWVGREWSTLDRFRRSDCRNSEYVRQFASDAAHKMQATYGGGWAGVVKSLDNTPYAGSLTNDQRSDQTKRDVLDGPDSPGRRWLLKNQDKPIMQALKDFFQSSTREPGQDG